MSINLNEPPSAVLTPLGNTEGDIKIMVEVNETANIDDSYCLQLFQPNEQYHTKRNPNKAKVYPKNRIQIGYSITLGNLVNILNISNSFPKLETR